MVKENKSLPTLMYFFQRCDRKHILFYLVSFYTHITLLLQRVPRPVHVKDPSQQA